VNDSRKIKALGSLPRPVPNPGKRRELCQASIASVKLRPISMFGSKALYTSNSMSNEQGPVHRQLDAVRNKQGFRPE